MLQFGSIEVLSYEKNNLPTVTDIRPLYAHCLFARLEGFLLQMHLKQLGFRAGILLLILNPITTKSR